MAESGKSLEANKPVEGCKCLRQPNKSAVKS